METRNFVFLFILLCVVGIQSKKITKRHSLVSRFTNNPFFLRHFGVTNDYDYYENYETQQPRVHFLTDSDDYEDLNTEDAEEEIEEIPTSDLSFFRFLVDEDENAIFKDTEKPVTDETPEIPISDLLLFPQEIADQHENAIIKDAQKPTTDVTLEEPIFNTLPFFEKAMIFRPNRPKNRSSEETVLYLFKSLPHFDRLILFREKSQNKESIGDSNKVAVIDFFKSLPHYDINQNFREDNRLEEHDLGTFPHFDKPIRRKIVRVVRKKKLLVPENASNFSEIEFGRRLKPRIRIESVADLPLEDSVQDSMSVLNSYGGLVSPNSS